MNCIVTLKINDYYPKLDTIPYENFICLFTYGDFFGKIPLIKKTNNICKHEIGLINSDIKYNIHILEYNESSLIGISEMVIPFIKIKKINPPGTMVHEQKIKLIIDLNTKRKLFGKLINSSEIYLDINAQVFIPDKKNILINNDIKNINNNIKKVKKTNTKIQVRIQNNKNKNVNLDGTPRTIKKKQIIMEMKSNREIIKNDSSNDNILNSNIYSKTIKENMNNNINDEKNTTGTFRNKKNIDNNQIKIIDFKNKNDKYNKNNEINLITKDTKKLKLNSKRSPKKRITILELLEQKMNNNDNNYDRTNTNYNNTYNLNQNSEIKNNIKADKKIININSSNNDKIVKKINIQNSLKRMNKNNNNIISNKIIYSPEMNNIILSPIINFNSPGTINPNKVKRHNSNGMKRINKKISNKNIVNYFNILNETDINKNNYNTLLIKGKRNTSQGTIKRKNYKTKTYKVKENNKKNSFKLGHHKRPKIDISEELYQRRSHNNKVIKEYSNTNNTNNNDLTSNNGLLSTEERTEQGLSEIDRIILEKSTELRDKFQNQINNNSNYLELNIKNSNKIKKNKIYNYNSKNNIYLQKIYFDKGNYQIIGGGNYTIETPKANKDFDLYINNVFDNKSSFGYNSQNRTYIFTQEDLKNNFIGLINLYSLLNKKLTKTIFEKNDMYKKLKIYKESYNNEIKKDEIMKDKNDNNLFRSYINMKDSLTYKIIEKIAYIKNLESKLYQNIFDYSYDDYEIIRTNEIERVNKLNEERKLKILLNILINMINNYGNVSQLFYNNKQKEDFLKYVLNKYNIKEKKEGEGNYINLRNMNLDNNINYKFRKYKNILDSNDIFENKIIREVDEDKEEEESVYSDKRKSNNHFYMKSGINDSQNIESFRQSLASLANNQNVKKDKDKDMEDNNNEIKNKNECQINEKMPQKEEKEEKENNEDNTTNNYKDKENENEGEKNKIENIKDILTNKIKNKTFCHINKNEFLFDNKHNIFVDLNNNNEIIIEIEKNKYNLEEFISIYCKDENKKEKEKEKFIYKRKRGLIQNKENFDNKNNKEENNENIDNNHQKKRRKRRIIDDELEVDEENNE